jgi:hypothetical protein
MIPLIALQRGKKNWFAEARRLPQQRRRTRAALAFGGGWNVTLGSLLSTLLALGLVLWSERRACSLCQGTGMAVCPVCRATGWEPSGRAQVCSKCDGVGRIPCPRCAGRPQRQQRPGRRPARSGAVQDK